MGGVEGWGGRVEVDFPNTLNGLCCIPLFFGRGGSSS